MPVTGHIGGPGHAQRPTASDANLGAGSLSTVTRVTLDAVPGHCGNDPGGRFNFADPIIMAVGDVDVPSGVHAHAGGLRQSRTRGRPTAAGIRPGATRPTASTAYWGD